MSYELQNRPDTFPRQGSRYLSADILSRNNEVNPDYAGRRFNNNRGLDVIYQDDNSFVGIYDHDGKTGKITSDVFMELTIDSLGAYVSDFGVGIENPIVIEGQNLGRMDGLAGYAQLNTNGVFRDNRSLGVFSNVLYSSGVIEGAFSTIDTAQGNPRLVAGEVKVRYGDINNEIRNSLVGVFVAGDDNYADISSFNSLGNFISNLLQSEPGYIEPGQSSQTPIDAHILASTYLTPGTAMGDAFATSIGEQRVAAFNGIEGLTFNLYGDAFVGATPGANLAASLDRFMAPTGWIVPEQWQFSLKARHKSSEHGASIPKGQNLFHLASPQGVSASFFSQGLELAYQPGKGPFTFTSGVIHEADSLLGAQARGFFGSLSADTFYVGSHWQADAGQWSFSLDGELGLVAPTVAGSSVIDGIDTLTTDAFGLEAARTFNNGNVLRFAVKQPLRVASGSMDYTFADGIQDGIVTGSSHSASLTPSGRQLDFTTALDVPVAEGDLSWGLTLSTDSGHKTGAAPVFALFAAYEAQW
ncbi:MAG: hypothetical protein OXI08_01445 [Cyanobacteria bacterium MAG IRC4_bin_6]|nr:hypothetical protein [Cyanobacteria bacterium MAG IRC4_bin_6]